MYKYLKQKRNIVMRNCTVTLTSVLTLLQQLREQLKKNLHSQGSQKPCPLRKGKKLEKRILECSEMQECKENLIYFYPLKVVSVKSCKNVQLFYNFFLLLPKSYVPKAQYIYVHVSKKMAFTSSHTGGQYVVIRLETFDFDFTLWLLIFINWLPT